MTDKKVWFITGAGRGMGVDIAKAALAAGNAVVATGRNTDAVTKAVGEAEDLLVVKLDVTSPEDAEAAVQAAVDRFGRIDVLVNNAANFYAGYFEELTPEQIERQLATSLIGPMNVTRAVLPVMRKQRSGHIIVDLVGRGPRRLRVQFRLRRRQVRPGGLDGVAAARGRAVRHHHHHRQPRVLPHRAPHAGVDDLRRRRPSRTTPTARGASWQWWKAQNGQQAGDPAKLAQALLTIASQEQPPRRFIAGADAIAIAEQKVADLQAQINAYRDLSTSLALDELRAAGNRR